MCRMHISVEEVLAAIRAKREPEEKDLHPGEQFAEFFHDRFSQEAGVVVGAPVQQFQGLTDPPDSAENRYLCRVLVWH